MTDQTLRIVVFRDDDFFIAQCLEYDIGTQAPTPDALRSRMEALIDIELEHIRETGQPIDAAPERFHKMWDDAEAQEDGRHNYRMLAAA